MVVACLSSLRNKRARAPTPIPLINLNDQRSKLCERVVNACEEFGFFMLENHGVSRDVISRVEEEAQGFFLRPVAEKNLSGPPNPFGYGCKNIGYNGDKGELEYLLLEANPHSVSRRSKTISNDPHKFSSAVNNYMQYVRNLACELVEMVAEGMCIQDKSIFSNLIRDENNDSCFRINHYPSNIGDPDWKFATDLSDSKTRIGFGEHSDPQILTILRSNDVPGLQILSPDGFWVPIPPESDKLCVFVGDAFQALTNGRFVGVRHRALAISGKPRMSMMYFAAPSLGASISPVPQLVSSKNPSLYRDFTWGEYKRTFYSLRLADYRLDLFRPRLR